MYAQSIMIVGANFGNKGAQSMLFVTVDEIKKRLPEAKIYFMSNDVGDFSGYTFEKKMYSVESKSIALNKSVVMSVSKKLVKDFIKAIKGHGQEIWQFNNIKELMPTIDLIIDISGYNIGKKWNARIQENYLDNIRLAKKYNVPIYLMPQSFGPFDYPEEKAYILKDLENLLPYATKIFAREREGYQLLVDTFHLDNVDLSSDLVLQNTGIDLNNIYLNPVKIDIPKVKNNAVGIIPNLQCFRHGNSEKNLEIYQRIINCLVEEGKEVYIFRHSKEDLNICKDIFCLVGHEHVTILENDFSCIEYDAFIRQFSFIICSRYHGIVHAYRNNVPCVLLGWAIKYEELASLFDQNKYFFNLTDENLKVESILEMVDQMCCDYQHEKDIIKSKLRPIQMKNCFDEVLPERVR